MIHVEGTTWVTEGGAVVATFKTEKAAELTWRMLFEEPGKMCQRCPITIGIRNRYGSAAILEAFEL